MTVPNSIIKCLSGVPLDNTYENTLFFANASAQTSYFNSMMIPGMQFTNQSFQRKNANTLRIEAKSENLNRCNYIMFQNTNYSNKWFYAFVVEVNYINDNTTEIVYELDVMQTWFFDFYLQQAWVEREHTSSDGLYEHTVPETLPVNYYVQMAEVDSDNFKDMEAVVICTLTQEGAKGSATTKTATAPATNTSTTDSNDTSSTVKVDPADEPKTSTTATTDSKTDGSKIVPMDTDYPLPDTPSSGGNSTSTAAPAGNIDNTWCGASVYGIEDIDTFTDFFNKVSSNGTQDGIIAAYMIPKAFDQNAGKGNSIHTVKSRNNYSMLTPINRYTGSLDGYTPKNKKMYCYPFTYLLVTTGDNSCEYHFENFDGVGAASAVTAQFNEVCSVLPPVSGMIWPNNYQTNIDSVKGNTNFMVGIGNFPICCYSIDTYRAYVAQNANNILLQGITAAAQIGAGIGMAVTGNPGGITTAVNGIGSALGLMADQADAAKKPDTGTKPDCSNALYASGNKKVRYLSMTCDATTARNCDDFLSRYGYKVNRLKVPNIHAREQWTYCKTAGCSISGSIPVDAARKICEIFDAGVTHWTVPQNVGNYSLSNNPL